MYNTESMLTRDVPPSPVRLPLIPLKVRHESEAISIPVQPFHIHYPRASGRLVLIPKQQFEGAELRVPIYAVIERDEDGRFIASEPFFHMHGDADTTEEAVADLLYVLAAYRRSLAGRIERLTPHLAQQFAYLAGLITLKQPCPRLILTRWMRHCETR